MPVSTMPAPYDIVWCRWPFKPDLSVPEKSRPALVRNSYLFKDQYPVVEVVYGTTNTQTRANQCDFVISKLTEIYSSGLRKATRFNLDDCIKLPWSEEWFEVLPNYSSPIIGTLTPWGQQMIGVTIKAYGRRPRGGKTVVPFD